ncbi:MAG: rhodanese-like domain-containing protein [Ferruginibacter sp.]|nr:rhodanese-like domain-containing protein [Ferruginibacter sp.]
MKKDFIIITIIGFCMSLSVIGACAQVKSSSFNFALKLLLNSSTPTINISDAASGANNYLFLDAREYKEYKVSHIPNARYIGDKNFSLSRVADIQKKQPVIVYCSIGKRSETITMNLKKAGYTNVQNLYGGIFEWINQDHKVYNINKTLTDSVHAYSVFWGRWLEKGIKVYD